MAKVKNVCAWCRRPLKSDARSICDSCLPPTDGSDYSTLAAEATRLHSEVERLKHVEDAARHYRFAGSDDSLAFLKRRGWTVCPYGLWTAPAGYPVDRPKSPFVALAVELELALGLHK